MKFISIEEYLMGRCKIEDLTPEQLSNANTIVPKANELLSKFGEYRKCNSGFRTLDDHLRIYKEKNDARTKKGLSPLNIPMGSKHLIAAAIDLEDINGKLNQFCKDNEKLLEDIGLWMEDPGYTPTWVHVQCVPPKSAKRIFIP